MGGSQLRDIGVILVIFRRKMKVFDTFGAKVIKWVGHYKVILGLKKWKMTPPTIKH